MSGMVHAVFSGWGLRLPALFEKALHRFLHSLQRFGHQGCADKQMVSDFAGVGSGVLPAIEAQPFQIPVRVAEADAETIAPRSIIQAVVEYRHL